MTKMADFDSIHNQARGLPLTDRQRLARLLLAETSTGEPTDEIAVGERGLAAWTDSTRSEDWSQFYPPSLRKRKAG